MAEACPGSTNHHWKISRHGTSATKPIQPPRRAGKRAGEKTTGGILGRRTTSSSDGQNFRTGSSGRYAGRLTRNTGRSLDVSFTPIFRTIQPVLHLHNQSGQGFNPCSDGLLYHESDLEIREHYTDTAVSPIMSLP